MLKKVIKIGDKDVAFRSSATVPRLIWDWMFFAKERMDIMRFE